VARLAEWDVERAVAEGVAESRAQTLEWVWAPLADHFGDKPVQQIDEVAITRYVAARREAGVRGQTIRREAQALVRALGLARQRGHIGRVPARPKIRSDAPLESARGQLHPPEVLAVWLAELHQDARDEVELCLRTGLRAAELKRVRASWVEPAPAGSATRYVLRVPAGDAKTRRERVIGLTDAAAEIIRRRVEADPEAEHVLAQGTHRRAYREAAERIGYGKRIKLRDLRHTFATLAVAGSGDPWAALESLGHRDLRTTSLYQHSTEARAAATAAAAERLLLGTGDSAQVPQVRGRTRDRTEDPRLVRRADHIQGDASSCPACQACAADHAEVQADAPCGRHMHSAQVIPFRRRSRYSPPSILLDVDFAASSTQKEAK